MDPILWYLYIFSQVTCFLPSSFLIFPIDFLCGFQNSAGIFLSYPTFILLWDQIFLEDQITESNKTQIMAFLTMWLIHLLMSLGATLSGKWKNWH